MNEFHQWSLLTKDLLRLNLNDRWNLCLAILVWCFRPFWPGNFWKRALLQPEIPFRKLWSFSIRFIQDCVKSVGIRSFSGPYFPTFRPCQTSMIESFVKVTLSKIPLISPNSLVWKSCGKAQLPHSFRRFARNYWETVPFHKFPRQEIWWNFSISRSVIKGF